VNESRSVQKGLTNVSVFHSVRDRHRRRGCSPPARALSSRSLAAISLRDSATLPAFRSYHVHVLFENDLQSDDCTGYDDTVKLWQRFNATFQVPTIECQGLVDLGGMCFFGFETTPGGPFLQPQWAIYLPATDPALFISLSLSLVPVSEETGSSSP